MEFGLRPLGFMELFAKQQSYIFIYYYYYIIALSLILSTLHIILHLVGHKPTK